MATLSTTLRTRHQGPGRRNFLHIMVAGSAALVLAACGSSSGSGASTTGSASGTTGSVSSTSAASSGSATVDQASLDAAKKAVATYVDPAAAYTGPTTGSPAPKGKSIVFTRVPRRSRSALMLASRWSRLLPRSTGKSPPLTGPEPPVGGSTR